jgi:hypothetical protein
MGDDVLENTLFVFASDNGGETVSVNVPYAGAKYYMTRGGYSVPAAIFGSLVPEELRGTTYDDLFHVTDWIPTLMHVATNGMWNGSMSGDALHGVDQWEAVTTADGSVPRNGSIQYVDDKDRMSLVLEMDGYSLSYHKGTAWGEVDDTDDTVSLVDYTVEIDECAVDLFSSPAGSLESVAPAAAMLETLTMHSSPAASQASRYVLVLAGVAVVALIARRQRGVKTSEQRGAESKLADAHGVSMGYGTV